MITQEIIIKPKDLLEFMTEEAYECFCQKIKQRLKTKKSILIIAQPFEIKT